MGFIKRFLTPGKCQRNCGQELQWGYITGGWNKSGWDKLKVIL